MQGKVVSKNTHFQAIVAFYTTNGVHTLEYQLEIDGSLRKILPPYMMPKLFYCTNFPTLVNGKSDRQKLIQNYETSLVVEANYTDEELNNYGCLKPELYGKARVVLNAVCGTIGMIMISNFSWWTFNSNIKSE